MGAILRTGLHSGLLTLEEATVLLSPHPDLSLHLRSEKTTSLCKLFAKSRDLVDTSELISLIPSNARFSLALGLELNDESPFTPEDLTYISTVYQKLPPTVKKGIVDCSLPRIKQISEVLDIDFCQINEAMCFSLPIQLLDFARSETIDILVHQDPKHISDLLEPCWKILLRKTIIYPHQQIIAATEFAVLS